MKIYCPLQPGTSGGGGTFLNYFYNSLDGTEFKPVDNVEDADVYFALGAQTALEEIPKILELKKKGMKVVFRVDGILNIRMPKGLERIKKMQEIADVVIYQSNYIKGEAESLYEKHNNALVIYNGVDLEMFHTTLKKPSKDFLICEYSQNPCKRLQESLGLMKQLIKINSSVKITIVGKYASDHVAQNFGLPQENVKFLGRVEHSFMPSILREHKVLLFPNMKEACSNLTLEAMSSGLMIIHKEDGCMPELCGDTQVHWSFNIRCIVEALAKRHTEERLEGRKRVEKLFDIKNCIKQYLNIMRAL